MADVFRYRYGNTNPVQAPVASATVIEIGDLVYLDTTAKPASDLSDTGTEAGNQEAFHDAFIGVAQQRSASGDTDDVRVATTGVFEFDTPSSSLTLGNLVGVDENGTGDGLLDQTVASVATANLAVGRVVEATSSATSAKVEIVSTMIYGGPQAAE